MDDSDVINFLLQTEIIPLCLRIMETGSELSKTVSQLCGHHPDSKCVLLMREKKHLHRLRLLLCRRSFLTRWA
jgi:hypothetical protein